MVLYAKDIVEKNFLLLSASSNVLEGARAMKSTRHGFAVIGTLAEPQGIVTEWDILAKVVAEGQDPQGITLGEIMSTELLSVEGGAGLAEVSQLMSERGVRRLLVKEDGKVIGYITSKTMLARMNDYVDKVSSQISRLQTPWF
jgi:signal-transduction protein with cAMP-binding, CBS, and nucleotidyltransferase domain